MLLLGIETATRRVGVVVASEDGMLGRVELGGHADDGPPRHAERLAPAIQYCFDQLGLSLDHVSAIAVDIGPGMFTGLRVGVTTAKVMAQALRVPMIPVPSLDLLAYPLRHARTLIVPAIDARRNELYYALYRSGSGRCPVRVRATRSGAPTTSSPSSKRAARRHCCAATACCASRSSSATWSTSTSRAPRTPLPAWPRSPNWRSRGIEREEFCAPDDVLPLYLRKSDAELARDRKDG